MKLRWRRLTQAELETGSMNGVVTVARTEHYSHPCVLEWQDTDFWTRVEMAPLVPPRLCGPTEEDLGRGRKLRERVYVDNRCTNFPCALEHGHDGPCSSVPKKGLDNE